MTVSLALVEGVACNTISSWYFLQTTKASMITENNASVSELLWEQFKMEVMVPQSSKEAPSTSEILSVSLPVAIPETLNNTEVGGIMDSTVELKNAVIHQRQIPGQH